MKQIITLLLVVITLISCTANRRAKSWGGTETITLEPHQRLINITWKAEGNSGSANLWYLTKVDTTKPSTYEFKEKSSFGVLEGKVIIIEQ